MDQKFGVKYVKPAQNAYLGYSYQNSIAFMLLAKMDIERSIDSIQIEADIAHQFDDVVINFENRIVNCQVKDINEIRLDDIKIVSGGVLIKGKLHIASDQYNLIFVKNIELECNSSILGFESYQIEKIHIIALSRYDAFEIIEELYKSCISRLPKIQKTFELSLDNRKLNISRSDLPHIEVFSTELVDKTIKLSSINLGEGNIVQIVGKPGVGKSHLVNHIDCSEDDVLYRFWISNQDLNYRKRLDFESFLSDISKKVFGDLVTREPEDIINKIDEKKRLIIIDGLDHVENYNSDQLQLFMKFLNNEWINARVIVFTRPLKTETNWRKVRISNWNQKQVELYLEEMLMISDYSISRQIYEISKGYPIIVNYLGKHFSKYEKLPNLDTINELEDFYDQLTSNVKVKVALLLFLCTKSYLMKSELKSLLDDPISYYVLTEFINDYPYLFDIKINRVSLIHDSFNTYLREKIPEYNELLKPVYMKVYNSLINGEKRYQSRFGLFQLSDEQVLSVIRKYANIDLFSDIVCDCIDYEAIRSFYAHIRDELKRFEPSSIKLTEYYDIGLILNIVGRDHFSTMNEFLYTYVNVLIFNGLTADDITSSEFLFGMYYYVIEKDIDILVRVTSDQHYSIENYYKELLVAVRKEEIYFRHLEKRISKNEYMNSFISGEMKYNFSEYFVELMVNLYIQGTEVKELKELEKAVKLYIDENNTYLSLQIIKMFLIRRNMSTVFIEYSMRNVRDKIKGLGITTIENDYTELSLESLIKKYKNKGSFDLNPQIHNYIRLSLFQNRKIDIESIGKYFSMYYMRKDYSLINIATALRTFEKRAYLEQLTSIQIILDAQELSEKGIRHILHNYVCKCDKSIITLMRDNFELEDLKINWLELPTIHIEMLSTDEFEILMCFEFDRNYIYDEVKYSDIKNALNSKFKNRILKTMKMLDKSLQFKYASSKFKEFKNCDINVTLEKKEERLSLKSDEEYLAEGILLNRSKDLVRKNNLTIADVALCTDGHFNSMAELELFSVFQSDEISKQMDTIFRNSLIAKIRSIDMYCSLFYFVGNSPQLLDRYRIDISWDRIYNSFMKYLEISLLQSYRFK